MADRPLPLEDADFWSAPGKGITAVSDDLKARGVVGIVADAPREVDLGRRDSLPVVVYQRSTIADKVAGRLEHATLLAAVRLESNEVFAQVAFQPREGGERFEGKPPTGFAIQRADADARARLELPWRPGTLALSVLCFDAPSAVLPVSLASYAQDDPAVRSFLEARKRPAYPRAVWPKAAAAAGAAPSYKPLPSTPKLPDAGPGIAVVVPRVVMLEPGARVPLLGRFRLTVLPREQVRPRPEVKAAPGREAEAVAATGWVDVGDPLASAVVPVHILITGKEAPGPLVITLQVPTHDLIDPGEPKALYEGVFAVDLLQLGARLAPDTYCLYLFSGAVRTGPIKLSIVTPGMVPPPGD